MKHIRKLIHIGFLLVFTAPAPLFCAPTFTIAGEVHDAGEARIPKAHVTAMNSEAGVTVQTDTDTVEVTADALSAETTSTQLGETLDTKKIESVPLNGRSFTDLMAVQPGIVPQIPRSPARSS
jgi:hypothetical protein